ncbi:MAG: DUF4832 domain-containing protein [Kiritimatiellae bacterium]|nr:DUF4832 domain-containing protein [Kiritimatiellia bacterium]
MNNEFFPSTQEKFTRRVRPTPTTDYLANPHKGCTTAGKYVMGDPSRHKDSRLWRNFPLRVPRGYLPCTVAYRVWYWDKVAPAEGEYDFSEVDETLAQCAQYGQTLSVRFAPHGPRIGPEIPKWYAEKYPTRTGEWAINSGLCIPVYDAPEYLEQFGGLVRAFAAKYDNHPLLETIDMALYGPWGEGAGEYSDETARRFAQLFKEAFPRTPRLALIGGKQLKAGVESGSGWRADCFGDLQPSGYGGNQWFNTITNAGEETHGHDPRSLQVPTCLSRCHHYDCYPERIATANAGEAWKQGPVFWETCWVPNDWYQQGFDLDFILEQGLSFHATYFEPKGVPMPEAWLDRLHEFCKKLGYRFVLRQAAFDMPAKRGETFPFTAWIENVGIAPLYHEHKFALRFRQGEHAATVVFDKTDTRRWMPGHVWLEEAVQTPTGLRPGIAELAAGLVHPTTGECRVRFAVKERYRDNWVPLGDIAIAD